MRKITIKKDPACYFQPRKRIVKDRLRQRGIAIRDEEEEFNLDAQQRRQVVKSLEKTNETVDLRLWAAYNWLLTPSQPELLGAIEFQASKISGDNTFYGQVYFDEASLLVHPDHLAEPPPLKINDQPKKYTVSGGQSQPGSGEQGGQITLSLKQVLSRYYGRIDLDPQRVNREVGLIGEEVIERLTSHLGCAVKLTLEIKARLVEGFDESTVRTTGENSRTLKFEHYGLEERL